MDATITSFRTTLAIAISEYSLAPEDLSADYLHIVRRLQNQLARMKSSLEASVFHWEDHWNPEG